MTLAGRRLGPAPRIVALVGAPTCAALVLAPGNLALAAAPSLLAGAAVAVSRVRLRLLALALLGLVLFLEEPLAFGGLWQPPGFALSEVLFQNLKHTLGIEALSVSPLDLGIGVLAAKALFDRLTRRELDEPGTPPPAPMTAWAAVLALGGVLLAEAWGLAHGGSLRMSLWQIRQLVALPLLTLLFVAAFRGPPDYRVLATFLVGAACLRAVLGFAFELGVKGPQGLSLPFMTSHDDSVLFVSALVAALAMAVQLADARARRAALLAVPVLSLAIVLNNRRIAYVELLACLFAVWWMLPAAPLKRRMARAALVALPLIALYVGAGWTSESAAFAPVRALRTVGADQDSSSAWRDQENSFLVLTLRQSPLLGTGFGREYLDPDPLHAEMASIFPEYRYLPHNSILGLWAFAGAAFAAIWLPVVLGLFLAARSLRHATRPEDRVASAVALSVILVYVLQGWADIGLQSWLSTFVAAAALATAARLAVATGAWPHPTGVAPWAS